MKARHLFIILAGALLVFLSFGIGESPRSAEPAALPTRYRPASPVAGSEIMTLGPNDWERRFEDQQPNIGPRTREDIVHLSGELQDLLAGGADPRGHDARGYADAIRELLDHRGE